jgi:hypothetical protein
MFGTKQLSWARHKTSLRFFASQTSVITRRNYSIETRNKKAISPNYLATILGKIVTVTESGLLRFPESQSLLLATTNR